MTQDKAPERSAIARAIYVAQNDEDDWIFYEEGGLVKTEYYAMADAVLGFVSQAYERGQVDMRVALDAIEHARPFVEAYDTPEHNPEQAAALAKMDAAIAAIRALPIDGKDEK